MTKDIDLDALQALAEKAGGRKWAASGATVQIPETDELAGKSLSITGLDKSVGKLYARYIAAANPQTVLQLIARIRELEGDTGKSAEAWQDMANAPKDRRVLVKTEREVYAAHWAKNPFTGDEAWIVAEWGDEGDQALVKPHRMDARSRYLGWPGRTRGREGRWGVKQRAWERFIWWICDTFGHRKSGSCNTEFSYGGMTHYPCQRCGRIVSRPAAPQSTAQTAQEE